MQAAVERIQLKAELADDRRRLLGLLCLAVVHSHICASLGLDKKLIKSLLDLHHKVPTPALPCPALPCPALPRPAPLCPDLPCPDLPCPASPPDTLPAVLGYAPCCMITPLLTVCPLQLDWFSCPDYPVHYFEPWLLHTWSA